MENPLSTLKIPLILLKNPLNLLIIPLICGSQKDDLRAHVRVVCACVRVHGGARASACVLRVLVECASFNFCVRSCLCVFVRACAGVAHECLRA